MKKYNVIQIIDNDGNLEYRGSYSNLLKRFNNSDECNEYLDNCKEKGYDYTSRTTYYDFEYNFEVLSKNWYEDITGEIGYENTSELVEEIIKKSFKDINNVRYKYIGDKYCLIILPKKYDSIILRIENDIDYKFFNRLLKQIKLNIDGRHNKTNNPKILVTEFVNNWRDKIRYADYNEGYRFYYNTIPQENKLDLLLK